MLAAPSRTALWTSVPTALRRSGVPTTPAAFLLAAGARARPVSVILVCSRTLHCQTCAHIVSSSSQQPQLLHGFPQHAGDLSAFWRPILQLLQYVISMSHLHPLYTDYEHREQLPQQLRLRV